jgi:ComF family protein
MKKILQKILSVLFPQRGTGFDFSAVSSEEILRTSPRAATLPTPRFPPRCYAVLSYKYPRTRAMVWQIKYKRDAHALRHGGFVLANFLREIHTNADNVRKIILVPIPISPARRRERGYNQCELLAEAILKHWPHKNGLALEIRTDILFRSTHKPRQTLKNRQERLAGAQNIFSVRKNHGCALSARVIVLDDVLTTGSTMREAMVTLGRTGFRDVEGVALGH